MTATQRGADLIDVEGLLGREGHRRTARHSGPRGDMADMTAHHFHDHDPVMGLRRGVQSIDRVGGDLHGGVKAEGAFGETDVVVDRLHADDRHPHLGKLVGTREAALATDHHEPADAMTIQRGPYPLDAVVEHERGVAARADDGAASRENAPAALDREFLERLLDQPQIPVVEAERAPAELALALRTTPWMTALRPGQCRHWSAHRSFRYRGRSPL